MFGLYSVMTVHLTNAIIKKKRIEHTFEFIVNLCNKYEEKNMNTDLNAYSDAGTPSPTFG